MRVTVAEEEEAKRDLMERFMEREGGGRREGERGSARDKAGRGRREMPAVKF